MKKQNIEDLFSSMENFSSVPPPELWGMIEERLDKPKKKKRAILWWSAAACLLVGLLLPSVLYFTTDSKISPLNNITTEGGTVVQGPNNKQSNDSKTSTPKQNDGNQTTTDPIHTQKQSVDIDPVPTPKQQHQKTAVAQVDSKSHTGKRMTNQLATPKVVASGQTNGFYSSSKNGSSNTLFEDKLSTHKSTALNGSNTTLNPNTNGKNKAPNESVVAQNSTASHPKTDTKFTALLSKQDSIQLAELQNLEKGIATENNPAKETKSTPSAEKWALEVFAGLSGSENYKNDKTLGNTNDSKQSNTYGLKTKYKLNKKWAVSSGLKINQLGQSVANVTYINTKNNGFLTSNDYFNQNATTKAPQIATNSNYVFVSQNATQALKANNVQNSNLENGNLDQSLRYIEMPLEVSYAIFSKNKASISLNTGGFVGKLISNNVSLNGSSIGENLNANEYVYGSVLSSTLQYRVYKKTNVFVEPAMNYYINPLNNQSFNQFQWGLNLGMNVSF